MISNQIIAANSLSLSSHPSEQDTPVRYIEQSYIVKRDDSDSLLVVAVSHTQENIPFSEQNQNDILRLVLQEQRL